MKGWFILIPVVSITTFLKSAARKTNIKNYLKNLTHFRNIHTKKTSININHFFINTKHIYINAKHLLINTKLIYIDAQHFFINTKLIYINTQRFLINTKLIYINTLRFLINSKLIYINAKHFIVNTGVLYILTPAIHGNSFTKTSTVACGILPIYARIRYLAGGGYSR